MTVGYKQKRLDGTACHMYHCPGEFPLGPQHGWIPGAATDLAVFNAVIEDHLSLNRISEVREAWREAKADVPCQQARIQADLKTAKAKAAHLDERCWRARRSGRRFLAEKLDGELNEKLKHIDAVEKLVGKMPPELSLMDEDAFDGLLTLLTQMGQLFWARTSSDLDRMIVLGHFIARVNFEGRTRETLKVRVAWKDGQPDTAVEVRLFRAGYPIMAKRLQEGADYRTIAKELNAAGYLNSRLRPWTPFAVGAAARAMALGVAPRHPKGPSA
jgi:hypothetical protein